MAIKTDAGSIWQEYKQGQNYYNKMGFASKWPEYVRFVEGDQWPAPTEKTKNMPRPVINQCDFTVENKQSNILSQTLKMVYSPEELPDDKDQLKELQEAAEDFTDAAENIWNDIDQDELNESAVNDTLVLGAGVFHYFWDNSIKGGQFTKYVGKLQGEIIEPKSIFLGNPQLKPSQIQKQPYIIVETQEDTNQLQQQAKANGIKNWNEIKPDKNPDNNKYDSEKNELEGAEKTTALTKYYRENGFISWTKVTENVDVVKPTSLAPKGSKKQFELYPIEILVFKNRRKCSLGRSIIADMITNQRILNTGIGLMFLSVQQNAWPKILAKVGALLQTVTNDPGEILTDHLNQQGVDGIKYMQPPNFSTMPVILTDKLLELTRQVTGVTEVSAGEVIGANMAASAIIALQNQAAKPNEAYEKKVFRSVKNIGRIYEEFNKVYGNLPRPIKGKDKDGKEITKKFIGSKSADINFGLNIDIGPKTLFSESLQMVGVDKMYDKGDLDKYQYSKYAPKNALPQELRHDFEKEAEQMKEQQVMMQKQQAMIDQALSQLTPEEQEELNNNPDLMNEFIATIQG